MSAFQPTNTSNAHATRRYRVAWVLVLMTMFALIGLKTYLDQRPPTPRPAPPAPRPLPKPMPAPEPVPTPIPAPIPQPPASSASQTAPSRPAPTKPATKPAPKPQKPPAAAKPPAPINEAEATTPLAYRKEAARHLYSKNANRIYKGKLQPMLYAVGVLQINIDSNGQIRSLHWLRAPSHAPEVIREIERTVRAAAPFPAPVRMGNVMYTETWLWDKSGRFQLDTLTEGQL